MPAHNLDDIDERDLSEAPRLAKESRSKVAMLGLVVAAVLFIALLVYGSLPELSPEEIISMEGYAGEQPTKHIFNIHSLEDKIEKNAAVASAESTLPPIAVTEPVVAEPEIVSGTSEELPIAQTEAIPSEVNSPEAILPASNLEPEGIAASVAKSVEPAVVEPTIVQPTTVEPAAQNELPIAVTEPVPEVERLPVTASLQAPAAEAEGPRTITFSTARDEKVIAAMATTPTIDEASDTVVISSVAALEPIPVPSTTQSASGDAQNSNRKLLPLRSVLRDDTELKASPSAQSKTLLSLRLGEVVTAFERYGDWIHVGTNDGSSVTGYVLESTLGAEDTNPG